MFRECALCGAIKTLEAYYKQTPPKTCLKYRFCKDCFSSWRQQIQNEKYTRREDKVRKHWDYQQESPITCCNCQQTKPTKYYTTLESDGSKFSDTCTTCEVRTCTRCFKLKPVVDFKRNPRVNTSFHRSCMKCACSKLQYHNRGIRENN